MIVQPRHAKDHPHTSREHGLPLPAWEDQPSAVTLTLSGKQRAAELAATLNKRRQALLKTLSVGELHRLCAVGVSE